MLRLVLLAAALLGTTSASIGQITVPAPPAPPPPPGAVYDEVMTSDSSTPPDFSGTLDDQDPVQNGKPYDEFSFDSSEGNEVTVTMTSQQFDTYLIVKSPTGREWTNDDFGSTSVSQVTFNAPTSGTYMIWATAFSSGRGDYEVRVSSVSATVVSVEEGRLDYEDEQLIKGEFFDELTIQPPARGEFFVELMPLGFNGYLRVTSPDGTHHSTEPTYGERQAMRVGPLQGERGAWTVAITTMSPGEVGAYDLRVITLDE